MQLYVTKAIRRGIVALWLLVLGTVLAYVIGSRLAPLTGHHLIVIRGGSMEPAIPLGSLVALRPVPADEIRPGDVVTMQLRNDTLVTHRVVRVAELADGPHLETKGDNNAEPDPVLVPAASALGVVAVEVPYAGFLVAFLSISDGDGQCGQLSDLAPVHGGLARATEADPTARPDRPGCTPRRPSEPDPMTPNP